MASTKLPARLLDTSAVPALNVTGNVGIGTSNPNNETNRVSLELDDTWGGVFQNSVSGTPKSEWRWNTSGHTIFGSVANEDLALVTNNAERMRIDTSGNVTFTGQQLNLFHDSGTGEGQVNITALTDGSSAAHSIAEIRMQQGTGDGSARKGEMHFRVSDNGGPSTAMSITNNSNVGIGTTTPGYQLDIENSSHAVARLHAGANSSASLRLKNDAVDWDVNCQTNDNFAIYNHTDASTRLVVKPTTGYVGIGFNSPNHRLEVSEGLLGVSYPVSVNNHLSGFNGRGAGIKFKSNTTDQVRIFYYHYGTLPTLFYDGDMHRFRAVSGTTLLDIGNTGNASLTGSLTQNASDERLKDKITEIPNAIDKIKELKGVSFEWQANEAKDFPHEDGKKDIGVIAQDVQKVLPEAVIGAPFDLEKDMEENNDGSFTEKVTSKSGKDYLTVQMEKLIPVLIQGIKEQQTIIEDLKTRIETLEG